MNLKRILSAGSCALLVACGDREARNYPAGSATDVVRNDGTEVSTNNLNSADIGIGGAPQRQSGNFQTQGQNALASDEELTKQVKVALTTGSAGTTGAIAENQLTKIDVKVREGVVTLSGPVSSESKKRTIGKQVAGMRGVKAVQNQLTVGGRSVTDKPIDPIVPRSPGNQ